MAEKRERLLYTLYNAIYRILQLLAPISPHIAEEIYQNMYADDKKHESIHISQWPLPQDETIDEEAEKKGDLIAAVIGAIRRDKAESKMPLNAPIQKLTIYSADKEKSQVLSQAEEDLVGTCKLEKMEVVMDKGEGREVQGYPDVHFTVGY